MDEKSRESDRLDFLERISCLGTTNYAINSAGAGTVNHIMHKEIEERPTVKPLDVQVVVTISNSQTETTMSISL